MQTKRIKCPQCGVVLDVKNSQNESVKQITCPSCKATLQVKFPAQQEVMEARTYYVPSQKPVTGEDGATQLAGGLNGTTQLVMPTDKAPQQARLEFEGHSYPLQDGENIIGRKGSTSKATVQIDTTDRYMSRQHGSITITTLPDGCIKAVFSNYQNKNLTTIDGQPIETGDAIRLTDGDSIQMGHTIATFKLS